MKAPFLVVLLLVSQTAFAQHRHHHHGYYRPNVDVYFATPYPLIAPVYSPGYHYPPVVVRQPPVVYIEHSQALAPPEQYQQTFEAGYWYYCQQRSAYYPAVKHCPGPWQQVGPARSQNR